MSAEVDTSREAIEAAFSDVLAGKGFSILKLSSIVHALRTALDAAQVREDELTEICCERNTEIASARLERDAEKARADRLAAALKSIRDSAGENYERGTSGEGQCRCIQIARETLSKDSPT